VSGATSELVAPDSPVARTYRATTRLDLADCEPDPALFLA